MNFIINNIFLIVVVISCVTLLLLPTIQRRGRQLSSYEVTQKMNREKVVLIDIRKEQEFEQGHIRQAMNIPEKELIDKVGRIERYKTDPIVIIDETGKGAYRMTSVLKKQGFRDVSSMEGGMKEWKSGGMPIEVSEEFKAKGKKRPR